MAAAVAILLLGGPSAAQTKGNLAPAPRQVSIAQLADMHALEYSWFRRADYPDVKGGAG
jgi:hypothetical protein